MFSGIKLAMSVAYLAAPWPADSMLGPWELEAPGYHASVTVQIEGQHVLVSASRSVPHVLDSADRSDPECRVSLELDGDGLQASSAGCPQLHDSCALKVRLRRPVQHFIEWP